MIFKCYSSEELITLNTLHEVHPFIVASFNAQSVKGNDIACKRCEISTFIKDNGVDLFFVTETWLSAQGDEAITAELAPSGLDVKSFPHQSRSCGVGIATIYKSTLDSNITFKTIFDFTHTSYEVVQASITLQHSTLHFFCVYRPPPNRRNNLTDSMFNEQLPDLLDYTNNLPGFVFLVGDMIIHFDNPLQSLTKQTLTADDIHKNLLLQTHLNQKLLCAGLLKRGMVCELERVLHVCDGFFCSMSVSYDCAVLL